MLFKLKKYLFCCYILQLHISRVCHVYKTFLVCSVDNAVM